MVINVSALKDGKDDYVEEEIRRIKECCGDKVLKVILECCLLTDEEKVRACLLAKRAGADFVKLFPAGEMGLGYVRAVRAPLAHIPLFAVGGVRPQDVAAFLDAGVAGFGVGGPLVPAAAVQAGDYDAIRARAEAFIGAIRAWEAAR